MKTTKDVAKKPFSEQVALLKSQKTPDKLKIPICKYLLEKYPEAQILPYLVEAIALPSSDANIPIINDANQAGSNFGAPEISETNPAIKKPSQEFYNLIAPVLERAGQGSLVAESQAAWDKWCAEQEARQQALLRQKHEQIAKLLLMLPDEKLGPVVSLLLGINQKQNKVRARLGYWVESIASGNTYPSVEMLEEEETGTSRFSFIEPDVCELRVTLNNMPVEELIWLLFDLDLDEFLKTALNYTLPNSKLPSLQTAQAKATSVVTLNYLYNILNLLIERLVLWLEKDEAPSGERLKVWPLGKWVIPLQANVTLLEETLQEFVQRYQPTIMHELKEWIASAFVEGTRKKEPRHLYYGYQLEDTGLPFVLEDYPKVSDFLEEYTGSKGHYNNSVSFDDELREKLEREILPDYYLKALEWLYLENPSYFQELVNHCAYLSNFSMGYYFFIEPLFSSSNLAELLEGVWLEIGDQDLLDCSLILLNIPQDIYKEFSKLSLEECFCREIEVVLPVERSRRLLEETGLTQFLAEAEKYCYTRAILTCVLKNTGQPLSVDMEKQNQKENSDPAVAVIKYGYTANIREWFLGSLLSGGGGGVILRSFLQETDPTTGFPVKELRAWDIQVQEEPKVGWANEKVQRIESVKLQIERLTPDDVYWASNTDSLTGKKLPPEAGVRYC
jgi:hypothetical protein